MNESGKPQEPNKVAETQTPTPPTLGRKIALWSFAADIVLIFIAIICYTASGGYEARHAAQVKDLKEQQRRFEAMDFDLDQPEGENPAETPSRSEQVVVNFDEYEKPTPVVNVPQTELPKGFGRAGSTKIEFSTVFPKLHSSGRIVEFGFFSKILSEEQQVQLSALPSLTQAQDPMPAVVLAFNFSPFRDTCELISISSYAVRFNAGADAFPFKSNENLVQFGRQMASNNADELKKMQCTRKKGGAYEVQVQGQGKTITEGGPMDFEWQLYSKGNFQ